MHNQNRHNQPNFNYEDFCCTHHLLGWRAIKRNKNCYHQAFKKTWWWYYCVDLFRVMLRKVLMLPKNSALCDKVYSDWIYDLKTDKSHFVPFTDKPYQRQEQDPKIFAYYLSQFHSIPENDDAHGKGFTEWSNVATATPQFVGHYQPKIPYDLGFYNLLTPGVLERQVEIAKAYGIYGFCFYYYWFSGRKVLEKPLEYFLNSNIDFHFHFCWANENWSKLWDGGNKEIILEQKIQEGDAERFFTDILPYIKDPRYEKIDNKPLLIIYRPHLFDKDVVIRFTNRLNHLAIESGFDGFFFMANNFLDFNSPKEYNCNGIVEFPPHGNLDKKMPHVSLPLLSNQSKFEIFSAKRYILNKEYISNPDYLLFKACFPQWDNTPRKSFSGGCCFLLDDDDFTSWLNGIINWTKEHNKPQHQYVYINAWNEWGEGAILEPTTRLGYRNLDCVKRCIETSRK